MTRRRHLRLVSDERVAAALLYGERSGTVDPLGTSAPPATHLCFSVVESSVPCGMTLAAWRSRKNLNNNATPGAGTPDAA